MAPVLDIRLLGGFSVTLEPGPVPTVIWRSRRARHLVALLALAPGWRLPSEEVMDRLWPEAEPPAAANNFHQSLYAVRCAIDLGAAGRHCPADLLALRSGVVYLQSRGAPLCWSFTPSAAQSWHSCGGTARKSGRMEWAASTG